jgi:xanthine dehydrogenase YagS FAD-binding subunit
VRPFEYVAVRTEAEAVEAVAGRPAQTAWIAGGTNLLDMMKLDVSRPQVLVDITALPFAGIVAHDDGGMRIGALARNTDVAHDAAVVERFPMLAQAILAGASTQLRNMATVGGNLVQRTRCSYFRDVAIPECNRRAPGSGCAALEGLNRGHAFLGTSESCIATHPSDMCVALAALDASVDTIGPRGARSLPFRDLHPLPEDHPELETTLEPGELITAVHIPPLAFARTSRYLKVRDRASYAFALVSAAVALDVVDGTVEDARVALGGVGTRPWRSPEAEQALRGAPATVETFEAAAAAATDGARPRRHNAFKVALAQRTVVRALTAVVEARA